MLHVYVNDEDNEGVFDDDNIDHGSSLSEIKMEINHENEDMDRDDSDEWVPTENKKAEKIKHKRKLRKNKPSKKIKIENYSEDDDMGNDDSDEWVPTEDMEK